MARILRREESIILAWLESPAPQAGIRAILAEGPPGCGKTSFGHVMAERWGAACLVWLLHEWTDADELFVGIDVAAAVAGDAAQVRQPGVLAMAAEMSQRGRVVLVLDELDKVQQRVENALLDFIQTGRVPTGPGRHLLANTANLAVLLTSNGQRPISEPLTRRCRRLVMRALGADEVVAAVSDLTKQPEKVVRLAVRAAWIVANAEGHDPTVQEVANLLADVDAGLYQSIQDLRIGFGQWIARTDKGRKSAGTVDLAALWGEIVRGGARNG